MGAAFIVFSPQICLIPLSQSLQQKHKICIISLTLLHCYRNQEDVFSSFLDYKPLVYRGHNERYQTNCTLFSLNNYAWMERFDNMSRLCSYIDNVYLIFSVAYNNTAQAFIMWRYVAAECRRKWPPQCSLVPVSARLFATTITPFTVPNFPPSHPSLPLPVPFLPTPPKSNLIPPPLPNLHS